LAAEPRSGSELAQLLMEKAAGDEKILFRLIDDEDIPDDGLGFHAQQAVEKMIKAVLAHHKVSYERTHNIAYLLTLLDGAGIPKPDRADDLPNLSPWAAELRYARQPEAVPNRQEMRSLVEQTKVWGVLAPNRERWPSSKSSTAQSHHPTEIKVYAVSNPPR
jgi:HEPN domain